MKFEGQKIVDAIHYSSAWVGGEKFTYSFLKIDPRVYPCRWVEGFNSFEDCEKVAKAHEKEVEQFLNKKGKRK
jgi:hypothetical protein